MPLGNLAGRARVDVRNPTAQGECDRCRVWYNRNRLQPQFQWAGAVLRDTGWRVCRRCLDVPFEQYRVLILPPDPIPVVQPRPSPDVTGPAVANSVAIPTSPFNQGFSQYILYNPVRPNYVEPGTPLGRGPFLLDNDGNVLYDEQGHPLRDTGTDTWNASKAEVLRRTAAASGIPTPARFLYDRSVVITGSAISQFLFPEQPSRGFLLFYNPSVPQVQIALASTVTWGAYVNLEIGPGEALFWSTSQGIGACYTGAAAVTGVYPGMEFWCWECPLPNAILTDENGIPITDQYGHWIATP